MNAPLPIAASFIALLCSPGQAQIGGNGKDGPLTPTSNTILDTTNNGGLFQFTRVSIPANVTVRFIGPNSVKLLSQGTVDVTGTLSVAAETLKLRSAVPGKGGPGGYDGGRGGIRAGGTNMYGKDGLGPGGGKGASNFFPPYHPKGGGGGAGHAKRGFQGSSPNGGAAGGGVYGSAYLFDLRGGSGGGGGYDTTRGGENSGGGGGGTLQLLADGKITIKGVITARGGDVNFSSSSFTNPGPFGGAGSGGGIYLRSLQGVEVASTGSVLATGGIGINRLFNGQKVPSGAPGFTRIDSYGTPASLVGKVDPAPVSLTLPDLREMGPPKLGSTYVLRSSSVPGDTLGVYLSAKGANIPFPPFGILKLDPTVGLFFIGTILIPKVGVDPVGELLLKVPASPNTKGFKLYFQAINFRTATNRPRLTNDVVTTII